MANQDPELQARIEAQLAQEEAALKNLREQSSQNNGYVQALAAGIDTLNPGSNKLKEIQETDRALKERLAKAEGSYTSNLAALKRSGKISALDMFLLKQQKEEEEKKSKANVPGFSFADEKKLPTADDAKKLKDTSEAQLKFNMAAEQAVSDLSDVDLGEGTVGTTSAMLSQYVGADPSFERFKQSTSDMELQYKELAKLGAITGPDMKFIEKSLGDLSSPKRLQILGKDEAIKILNRLNEKMVKYTQEAAKARGYRPQQATQVAQPAPAAPANQGAAIGMELAKKYKITPAQAKQMLQQRQGMNNATNP